MLENNKKECNSKGFVHTLESVIAVALILSFLIFILPKTYDEKENFNEQIYYKLQSLDECGVLRDLVYERNITALYNEIDKEIKDIKAIEGFVLFVEYFNFTEYDKNVSFSLSIENKTRVLATILFNTTKDIDNEIIYNSSLSSVSYSGTNSVISSSVSGNNINIQINATLYPYTLLLRELYKEGTEYKNETYYRVNYVLSGYMYENTTNLGFLPSILSIKYYI